MKFECQNSGVYHEEHGGHEEKIFRNRALPLLNSWNFMLFMSSMVNLIALYGILCAGEPF
jgi:hypothetical protein